MVCFAVLIGRHPERSEGSLCFPFSCFPYYLPASGSGFSATKNAKSSSPVVGVHTRNGNLDNPRLSYPNSVASLRLKISTAIAVISAPIAKQTPHSSAMPASP